MLMSFSGKNHLLYFSLDAIDIRLVCGLAEYQIFCVGEVSEKALQNDDESRQFLS